jgi:hypothetical protein
LSVRTTEKKRWRFVLNLTNIRLLYLFITITNIITGDDFNESHYLISPKKETQNYYYFYFTWRFFI